MTLHVLSAVIALLATYLVLMCGLFLAAYTRGVVLRRRAARSAEVVPVIRAALVDYISGSNDLMRLKDLAARHPTEFPLAVTSLQAAVSGNALDRLCALMLGFSLLDGWISDTRSRDPLRRRTAYQQLAFATRYEPCRREIGDLLLHAIRHPDPDVRIAASRGVLHQAIPAEVESVFRMAISESPLVRVLLSEDLRRHSALLCGQALPEALRLNDAGQIAAALELVAAWERALPVADLHTFLYHPDRRVRIAALSLAPLVAQSGQIDRAVLGGLADPDSGVAFAAADAARRMRLGDALPALARLVRKGSAGTARAAAAALAALPPRGWETLQELKARPERGAAAAAAEALAALERKIAV